MVVHGFYRSLAQNSPGASFIESRELTGPQESATNPWDSEPAAYQAGPGARELYLRTRRDAMKEAQNDDGQRWFGATGV